MEVDEYWSQPQRHTTFRRMVKDSSRAQIPVRNGKASIGNQEDSWTRFSRPDSMVDHQPHPNIINYGSNLIWRDLECGYNNSAACLVWTSAVHWHPMSMDLAIHVDGWLMKVHWREKKRRCGKGGIWKREERKNRPMMHERRMRQRKGWSSGMGECRRERKWDDMFGCRTTTWPKLQTVLWLIICTR